MKKFKLVFKYDGKEEIVNITARNFANANYQATQIAVEKKLPSHVLSIIAE